MRCLRAFPLAAEAPIFCPNRAKNREILPQKFRTAASECDSPLYLHNDLQRRQMENRVVSLHFFIKPVDKLTYMNYNMLNVYKLLI